MIPKANEKFTMETDPHDSRKLARWNHIWRKWS